MSVGIQFLVAIAREGARAALRETPRDWFQSNETAVYDWFTQHYRDHGAFPSDAAWLVAGHRQLEAADPSTYYRQLMRRRRIRNAMTQPWTQLHGLLARDDLDAAVAVLTQMYRGVVVATSETRILSLAEGMELVMEAMRDARIRPEFAAGLTLGWEHLDEMIGGAQPGDVVTIVGRPGMGKSYVLMKMLVEQWLAGNSVLCLSMEMGCEAMARRVMAELSAINPDNIRRGQVSAAGEAPLQGAIDIARAGRPFWLAQGGFGQSVAQIDALALEFMPDVIGIDASYLVQSLTKNRSFSTRELLQENQREIKGLAVARNRPVIQTVQFNRKAGNRGEDGTGDNIFGSDWILQLSSIVFGILPGLEDHTRRLKLLKVREASDQGQIVINFRFDPFDMSFVRELGAEDLEPERQRRAAEGSGW